MFEQEEEEDEYTEQFNTFKPSYVLIAIDTDSSMFEVLKDLDSEEERETCFVEALYACCKVASSLVLTSGVRNYNEFGVVFGKL